MPFGRLALGPIPRGVAATGGAPTAPPWFVGAVVPNDFNAACTQSGVSTVRMPFNGAALRLTTNYGVKPTVSDRTKMKVYFSDPGHNRDGSANDNVQRAQPITANGRIPKNWPDHATFTDADYGTGVIEVALGQRVFNSSRTDTSGRTFKTSMMIVFEEGFLNGNSEPGVIFDADITRLDSRHYPLPIWKLADVIAHRFGSSGTVTIGVEVGHRFFQQGQMVACVEAAARKGGVDGPIARASYPTESRWTADRTVPYGAPAAMTLDEFALTISSSGLSDGALDGSSGNGIWTRIKPWIGPICNSYDTVGSGAYARDVGDVWATVASQNLLAFYPGRIDVADVWRPWYAWVDQAGVGGATGTTGVSRTLSDPGAGGSYASAELARQALRAKITADTGIACDDGGEIVLRSVAGSTKGQDANSYSSRNTNWGTIVTQYLPLILRSASGTWSDGVRWRGALPDGTANTNKNLPAGKIIIRGLHIDGTGVGDIAAATCFVGGTASPSPGTGINANYVIFIDCYGESASDTATNRFISGFKVFGLIRTTFKFAGNSSRAGFPGNFVGIMFQIGSAMLGASSYLDGPMVLACYTDLSQIILSQASTVRGSPLVPTTKQILIRNNRFDTKVNAKGAVGTDNPAFGRGRQMHGMVFVGNLLGRYGGLSNTILSMSDDNVIPELSNRVFVGNSIAGTQANRGTSRINWLYQDNGWVRIDKEIVWMFNVLPSIPSKGAHHTLNATITSPTATVWSNSLDYEPGEFVYDNAGALTPQTGAPTYQARQWKLNGDPVGFVPAGTLMTDTDYWYRPPTLDNVMGAQAQRSGNRPYKMCVDGYGNVSGSVGSVGGTDMTVGAETTFTDVDCPGSPNWGTSNADTYYVNDTTGASGTPGTGDYRPNPAGPLMGLRPAGSCWDTLSFLGQARNDNVVGPAGALEAA